MCDEDRRRLQQILAEAVVLNRHGENNGAAYERLKLRVALCHLNSREYEEAIHLLCKAMCI